MSGRFKPYSLIVLGMLLAAFLLNPPVAFATKLPTACNIFQEKKAAKLGTCGHQVTFTKDKFHWDEMALSNGTDSGRIETLVVFQNNHLSLSFPSVIFLNSIPLRC